jgi:hypothetical protein
VVYVDGSYAAHENLKGQSGVLLMIGDSAMLSRSSKKRSSKQKIKTRNSTERELIAVDDALPTIQWANLFMKDQGYDLTTIIKENNKSTLLLIKNGRLLLGKRTKHLDIRYFCVQDLI